MELCFKALAREGLKLDSIQCGRIKPEDIVAGHREHSLGMLWRLILHWKIDHMIDIQQLQQEVDQLVCDYIRQFRGKPRLDDEHMMYLTSPLLNLLLRWCQAVCAFYGVNVSNFTTSFADGSVICYLISYYHPDLIQAKDVMLEADIARQDEIEAARKLEARKVTGTYWFHEFSPEPRGKLTPLQRAGRHNYKMLSEVSQKLGGVPLMCKL
jgi:abnormal spindle-like microcephaly-associated protein